MDMSRNRKRTRAGIPTANVGYCPIYNLQNTVTSLPKNWHERIGTQLADKEVMAGW